MEAASGFEPENNGFAGRFINITCFYMFLLINTLFNKINT